MATNILELLGRQRRQRVGSAADTLATAARQHAAGKVVDVEAVDRALHELSMPPEHFEELCRIAALRRDAKAAHEKLGTAEAKHRRLEEAIAAERQKLDEYRQAYVERVSSLEAEQATAAALVAKGRQARDELLKPTNVLGAVRQRLEEALTEQQAAVETDERLRRELREQHGKVREADRWIASIMQTHEHDILPTGLLRSTKTLPPAVVRELEPHELAKARALRRVADLEPQVREAAENLDRAQRTLVTIELEVIKS